MSKYRVRLEWRAVIKTTVEAESEEEAKEIALEEEIDMVTGALELYDATAAKDRP